MICPHRRVVTSSVYDVCLDCGTRIRTKATEEVQELAEFSPIRPPQIPGATNLARDKYANRGLDTGPRVATPNFKCRREIPKLLLVLAVAALLGRGIHSFLGPVPQETPGEYISPLYPSQANTLERNSPPLERPTIPEEYPSEAFLASLEYAPPSYVPLSHYKPLYRSLSLQNSGTVPEATKADVMDYYRSWKEKMSDGESSADQILEFYAPDAKIFTTPVRALLRDSYRNFLSESQKAGYFSLVADQKEIQWGQNASGDEVELLAYHVYSDDSGNKLWGQRRLLWKHQGDKWFIIQDEFPPNYKREPKGNN